MAFLVELDWPAFLFAMFVIELTPGPNMGWLAALSAQHGTRVGFMAVCGITLGLAIQVIAAATGVAALISGVPVLYDSLRWAGVLFMLWLAWLAFVETGSATPAAGLREKGFQRGLIANLLNPKALVFYVIVIGQFTTPAAGAIWQQVLILGGLHLAIAAIVHVGIVGLAASASERLEGWQTSLSARIGFSLCLVAIAVWIAFSTR